MKTATSLYSCLAAALFFVLSGAGIAAAQFNNTYYGSGALASDPSGTDADSAFGNDALHSSTTGEYKTAVGANALSANTNGDGNTAVGAYALYSNDPEITGLGGYENTAAGENVLRSNTTGTYNTAVGASALVWNTTGDNNIGIGDGAGTFLTTGSNNIDIGNAGVAGESTTIRVGLQGLQTDTYIAGIYKEKVGTKHCAVLVDSDGKHGCGVSKAVDTSMLLDELQKQTAQMAEMKASMRRQAAELKASRERELATRTAFEERLSKLERVIGSKHTNRNLAAAFNR